MIERYKFFSKGAAVALKSINIAVLNYNGRAILEECLPSIIISAENYPAVCRITVIDNRSTDDSVDFIKTRYPGRIEIYEAPDNAFLVSYNEFMKNVKEEIVVILNNDIKTSPDFLMPLIAYFDKPDTFFVSTKMMDFDGSICTEGRNNIINRLSLVTAGPDFKGHENDAGRPSFNFYTGNGAFSVSVFNELGGFDGLYLPGYMEDVDLCYRGWKAGYSGYYEPSSVIYHRGGYSFNRDYSRKRKFIIAARNNYLFAWKNFGFKYLAINILLLPVTLLAFLATGRFLHIAGFFSALLRSGMIKRGTVKNKRTDAEIFRICKP
jgi:N-acetylglucosaminyl-diphospho-decaprenol L-rhamnosyltransferase